MMAETIKQLLRTNGLLSPENTQAIADGPGFRLDEYRFVSRQGEAGKREYKSTDGQIQSVVSIKLVETTIVISNRIRNIGTAPTLPIHILEPLHLTFNRPCDQWRHIHLAGGTEDGAYPPEAYARTDRTYCKHLRIESDPDGRSSNLHLPLLMSLFSEHEESEGFFCGLEWSGLWYIEFSGQGHNKSSLSAGIKVNGIELEPDEVLELPDVHIGFFKGGPAEGGNALRKHLYSHVCARYQDAPVIPAVSCNHWQSDLRFDLLKNQADRAAQIGVEVFIIDAGWFLGDFPMGVGNWDQIDESKFPQGLKPLSEYARNLGMDFGLWFEPERAAENTALLNQHPDWFFPGGEGRNYHLNLALPEARQYLIDMIGGYIERLDLRWIKWDYNIKPFKYWEAADNTLKIQFEYVKGLYEVLDTLMEKYPNCRLEGCASGGRRIDLGIIKRSHTLWLSDAYHFPHNPLLSRYMQARANNFLPGHLLLTWVSAKPADENGGVGHAAILSRMAGHLGFNGDVASWTKEQTQRSEFWVNAYKAIRHLLVQRFYQLLPTPASIEDWDALQFVDHASTESVLFVFAGNAGGRRRIVMRGLDSDRDYSLIDFLTNGECHFAGVDLINEGFQVDLHAFGGGLWRILSAGV